MKHENIAKKILDPKQTFIDPPMTWPFVIGIKEALKGDPKDPKRWLNQMQQRAWGEGWDLGAELAALRKVVAELPSLEASPPAP